MNAARSNVDVDVKSTLASFESPRRAEEAICGFASDTRPDWEWRSKKLNSCSLLGDGPFRDKRWLCSTT